MVPSPSGSALHVTERFPAAASASTASAAGMAWDVRTLLLVLLAAVPSLV